MYMDINSLLALLAEHGGSIVSTAALRPEDIDQARASGRMYVDENSLGYVWEPNIDRFPETPEEVQQFEKWFPLPIELPKGFATYESMVDNWKNKQTQKQVIFNTIIEHRDRMIDHWYNNATPNMGSEELKAYNTRRILDQLRSMGIMLPQGKIVPTKPPQGVSAQEEAAEVILKNHYECSAKGRPLRDIVVSAMIDYAAIVINDVLDNEIKSCEKVLEENEHCYSDASEHLKSSMNGAINGLQKIKNKLSLLSGAVCAESGKELEEGWQQELFNYLNSELGCIPLHSQCCEIRDIILKHKV